MYNLRVKGGNFMKRFKNDWLVYFILSVLAIGLGIVLIVEDCKFGLDILNIVIAVLLIVYLILYLAPIMSKKRGKIQILTIVEFVIIALIALGLVLQQFKVFNIAGSCKILGLVLWLRAVVELFRAYFYRGKENSGYSYSIWYFIIMLVLITLGTWMFASPFFADKQVVIALAVILFLLAVTFIILGIIYVPKANKKSKKNK